MILPAVLLLCLAQDPASFILDEGGVLRPDQEETLLHMFRRVEASHCVQVGVVTVNFTDGKGIDAFAVETARAHGFDRKPKGILMVVVVRERKVRIDVGGDLEGSLPASIRDQIIRNEMVPSFLYGKIGDGTFAGLAGVVTAVRGDYHPRPPYVRYRSRYRFIPWWIYPLAGLIYFIYWHRKLGEFGGGFAIGRSARKIGRGPGFQGSGASGRWC